MLYIRNIAEKTTEEDVLRYCTAFGHIPEVCRLGCNLIAESGGAS